jgi:hypothetical protein
MKLNKYMAFVIVFVLFKSLLYADNTTSVAEFYENTNPGKTATAYDIRSFVYGYTMNCESEVKGTGQQRKQFCTCFSKTMQYNMINRLSPEEAKETISGAAHSINPMPHSEIVFYGIREKCTNVQ